MTEEEIQQQKKELAELKEALVQKEERIRELKGLFMEALLRIEELERRLVKDSHNSSLPPSRDHGTRKPLDRREKSQKKSGEQPGHPGQTLIQVKTPDEVIVHRPTVCSGCQRDLSEQASHLLERRQELLMEYVEILRIGSATQPIPPLPKRAGHQKQNPSLNLLDAFLHWAEQVLGFLDDLSIPFTNNLAERDLRMLKVQQKISGTFRSAQGITAFCALRSLLSTMRKQGRPLLVSLRAVFVFSPVPIACEPGT